jgi:TolB-like protein/DNA-binding winged helix-turn-helix (wHTH) protein/Flp pilus assembly protein TadD
VKIVWTNNLREFTMIQQRVWSFGPFELDPGRFELRRNGRPLRIERIPMELLILLVSRDGQLVERQDIVQSLWGPGLHVDSEQGINTAIRKLRQILRDDPEKPKFIQTVVGKGYRFVGAANERRESQGVQFEPAAAPAEASAVSGHTHQKRALWIGTLVCALALVASASWPHLHSARQPVSLAVLPFENLTGSPGRQYLADGMTEETISLLGSLSPARLRVVARTSVMQYRNTLKPVSQIGRELGVGLVVESSLREESGHVRITVQLIRVNDQMHLWAHSYEGDLGSALAMQMGIASAIAGDLQLHLSPEQQARMVPARQIDLEAYNVYLRGRYFWNLRDESSLEKASQYFQQAIDRAPTYAAAYAGLADSQSLLAYGNYRAPVDAFGKAKSAAQKALQLDPAAAEPHASLGYIKLYYDWDFPGAERELRRAVELNSNYATAHDWLGYLLTAKGDFSAAASEFRKALILDPLSVPVRTDTGFGLHYAGDQPGAIRELRSALEMNPRFALAHFWLGRAYGAIGQCDNSLRELAASEPVLRDWQPLMAAEGHFLGRCGRPVEAKAILARFAELSKTRYVTSYGVALVQAGLNRPDEALNALERAFDERSHWLVWLRLDPRFSMIRGDPRFQNLLARIGLNRVN